MNRISNELAIPKISVSYQKTRSNNAGLMMNANKSGRTIYEEFMNIIYIKMKIRGLQCLLLRSIKSIFVDKQNQGINMHKVGK